MHSGIIFYIGGITGLSDMLDVLIHSLLGRILMLMIGFSYFIIDIWKVMQMRK